MLARNPFREGAHRLEMRIANATGDEDGANDAIVHRFVMVR